MDPRRSRLTKPGIAVDIDDGTEDGIQFTLSWGVVGQTCLIAGKTKAPEKTQKKQNRMDLLMYYNRLAQTRDPNERELAIITDMMSRVAYP